MFPELQQAIEYRQAKQYDKACEAFHDLYTAHPDDALVNYHYAWLYDNLGEEQEAVPHYQTAIENGLSGDDLRGALLGLGSTYRTLGMYTESAEILKRGIELYPSAREFQVFYAMTQYNLGQYHEAMTRLLTHIATSSEDAKVRQFSQAINLYAKDLDRIWK